MLEAQQSLREMKAANNAAENLLREIIEKQQERKADRAAFLSRMKDIRQRIEEQQKEQSKLVPRNPPSATTGIRGLWHQWHKDGNCWRYLVYWKDDEGARHTRSFPIGSGSRADTDARARAIEFLRTVRKDYPHEL